MLTKAAKEMLRIVKDNYIVPGITSVSKAYATAKTNNGNTVYTGYTTTSTSTNLITSFTESGSNASRGFAVGSGNTPANENDYCIESLITDLTLSATPTIQPTYDAANNKYISNVELALSNATQNDITVSEIGYFVECYTASALGGDISTSASAGRCIMTDRTVLDTPVVIPAGQSGLIRYSFVY